MRKKAFTLIELLVVIAIIAILAAILFPVFAQAKLAAKKTQTLSNMKQLALASLIYASDYDDMYHLIRTRHTANPAKPLNWATGSEDLLEPYVKNVQLHDDVLDPVTRDDCGTPFGSKMSFSWTHYRSDDIRVFGVHGYNAPTWTPAQARWSLTQTAVGSPASTINMYPLWTTASYSNGYTYYRYYTDDLAPAPANGIPSYPQALSFTWCSAQPNAGRMSIGAVDGRTNYGFVDGHVKTMSRNQTMVPVRPWTQANIDNADLNLYHYDERFKK
jgi:prepilin-type N-terminal cleavage/methylation domain-containing protein/prepilin-type processing-associated H-X9-DG protein